MSFYSEILNSIGLKELNTILDYNIINYGGKAVYVDGFDRILKIESEQIALDTKKTVLEINGELTISLLEEKAMVIKGRVDSIIMRDKNVREK